MSVKYLDGKLKNIKIYLGINYHSKQKAILIV